LFRRLPTFLDRLLDRPRLLRWATSRAASVDPKLLGGMAVSMLRGEHGYQRKEVRRLCRHLAETVRPDLLLFTNILIGGCIPEIRRALGKPILVTLQGDDSFLDSLAEPYRSAAFEQIRRLVPQVDGFLVHSRFYGESMQRYFGISADRIHHVPLGIETAGFSISAPSGSSIPDRRPGGSDDSRTIGYLARLAPEKGLHVLVEAFLRIREQPDMAGARLAIAGWLGDHQRSYAEAAFERLRQRGLGDAFDYIGEVDRAEKIGFLQRLDIFSVPATYGEPKGLYALEALAAGIPVVLPAVGAFPELIESTGGGILTKPDDAESLAAGLLQLLRDDDKRRQMGNAGRSAVHRQRNAQAMAAATLKVLEQYFGSDQAKGRQPADRNPSP
jgi:glycosyltransferase involved in cell wall biosynthesis